MRGTKKVVIFGLVTILLLLVISSAQASVMGEAMGEQPPTREINVGGNGPNPLWPLPRIPEPEAEVLASGELPVIEGDPEPDDEFPVEAEQEPASGLESILPKPEIPKPEAEEETLLIRPFIPPPEIPKVKVAAVPASELELIQPESEFPEVKAEQIRADELSEIEPELIPAIPEPEKKRVPAPTGIPEPEKEPVPNPDNDKFPTKAECIRTPLSWIFRLSQLKGVLALK